MYKTLLVASAMVAVQGVKISAPTTQLPAEDQAAKIANTTPDQDIGQAKVNGLAEGQNRVQEQQNAINDNQIKNDVASSKMKEGEAEAAKAVAAEKEARQKFISTPINRAVEAEVPNLDAINPQGAVMDAGAGELDVVVVEMSEEEIAAAAAADEAAAIAAEAEANAANADAEADAAGAEADAAGAEADAAGAEADAASGEADAAAEEAAMAEADKSEAELEADAKAANADAAADMADAAADLAADA